MTVDEEIALGLENLGVDHATMVDTIAEVLQTVGLTGVGDRSPFQLSGGQQQRLAIASALAMRPRILVMDEPTSNVDPIGKEEIFQTARKLNQEQGMTVIVAEHEVEVMAANADRIVVLDKGRVILNGTPEEVFSEVDTLMDIGLRVPQVTEFAHLLRREGLMADRPLLPVTIDVAEGVVREIGNPVKQERRNG
jgi:energy-coupling factor transport system ATP-binding protein